MPDFYRSESVAPRNRFMITVHTVNGLQVTYADAVYDANPDAQAYRIEVICIGPSTYRIKNGDAY